MGFLELWNSIPIQMQCSLVGSMGGIVCSLIAVLLALRKHANEIKRDHERGVEQKPEQKKAEKLTRKERQSIFIIHDHFRFLATDVHPRRPICPECAKAAISEIKAAIRLVGAAVELVGMPDA